MQEQLQGEEAAVQAPDLPAQEVVRLVYPAALVPVLPTQEVRFPAQGLLLQEPDLPQSQKAVTLEPMFPVPDLSQMAVPQEQGSAKAAELELADSAAVPNSAVFLPAMKSLPAGNSLPEPFPSV